MNANFLHPSAKTDAGPACCCPGKAAVRVVMPPTPTRPHETDVLLCGHHYRASRAALTVARAVARALPGTGSDVASWIGVSPLVAG
jgi:hypothetical protein